MYTFDKTSATNYKGMTKTARKNMEYMQKIMKKCGFTVYDGEWWHFTDKNADKYVVTNLDLAGIPMARCKDSCENKLRSSSANNWI